MRSDAQSRPRGQRWSPGRIVLTVVLAVGAFVLLFPLLWMVSTSLKPERAVFEYPPRLIPAAFQASNYVELFTEAPFARQFFNSVYIGALNVIGTVAISSLAGYAFARARFPGRSVVFVALLSALLLPNEVTIVPLYQLFTQWNWIGTHLPLLIAPVFGPLGVIGTFLMRQFFLSLPTELEDAGRIDGLGRLGLFWYIALPLAKPALATLTIVTLLDSWNAFLEPLVYTAGRPELWTLPVALNQFVDADGTPFFTLQMAASTLSSVPVIVIFVLAQRYVIEGVAHSGLKA